MRVGGIAGGCRESGRNDPKVSTGFSAEKYLVHVVCDINHLPCESLALWFSQSGQYGTNGACILCSMVHFEVHW